MQIRGILYVVALPIGNPNDITLRALEILKKVDVIAAEDTRTFREISKSWNLNAKKVISHHEHNEAESTSGLITLLLGGSSVAITTDAGTPNVSDPGFKLIREANSKSIQIVPIPGASSLTAALSSAPIGGRSVYFGGFAPASSSERLREFSKIKGLADKAVYFESPHRLIAHLQDAFSTFGDCEICVARELTKPFEEIQTFSLQGAISHFENTPPKGEFVLVYRLPEETGLTLDQLKEQIHSRLKDGLTPSDIVKEFQRQTELKKNELYNLVLSLKDLMK